MKKRKEDLKELVLYTVFGNMTFIISIGAYAVFNVALGINVPLRELRFLARSAFLCNREFQWNFLITQKILNTFSHTQDHYFHRQTLYTYKSIFQPGDQRHNHIVIINVF